MESVIKKYQQKFRRVREELNLWKELQSLMIKQFSNAASVIKRLPLLRASENYGVLGCIQDAVLTKQLESLQTIFQSMNNTMEEFHKVVLFLEKVVHDSKQLVKGGSSKQLQQRIGTKPTLADCLEGLRILYEMHQDEYALKLFLVSSLSDIAIKPSGNDDLGALEQFLVDQPNIPQEEVQFIYDIIFAEEMA